MAEITLNVFWLHRLLSDIVSDWEEPPSACVLDSIVIPHGQNEHKNQEMEATLHCLTSCS